MDDAVGEDAGLAAARPGDDEQGAAGDEDGLALGGIEILEGVGFGGHEVSIAGGDAMAGRVMTALGPLRL